MYKGIGRYGSHLEIRQDPYGRFVIFVDIGNTKNLRSDLVLNFFEAIYYRFYNLKSKQKQDLLLISPDFLYLLYCREHNIVPLKKVEYDIICPPPPRLVLDAYYVSLQQKKTEEFYKQAFNFDIGIFKVLEKYHKGIVNKIKELIKEDLSERKMLEKGKELRDQYPKNSLEELNRHINGFEKYNRKWFECKY